MSSKEFREELLKLPDHPDVAASGRFDRLKRLFFNKDYWAGKERYHWNFDLDMQRRLLIAESASIAQGASSGGWELHQRCYGNGGEALKQYKMSIERFVPFSDFKYYFLEDTIAIQVYHRYHFLLYGHSPSQPTQKIQELITAQGMSYIGILGIIDYMMYRSYGEVWVYIHYESYFLQVRFLYRDKNNEWCDSADSIHMDNYEDTVVLHTYATLVHKHEWKSEIVTVHSKNGIISVTTQDTDDIWKDIIDNGKDISACDEDPFCKSYKRWKEKVLGETAANDKDEPIMLRPFESV
ncbi:MAG: hypothetical protein LBS19_06295 [Clostridiales bacterium]|jgi:hypothetical protein|nr:hypothetical protein [Clostridiales bacterium]